VPHEGTITPEGVIQQETSDIKLVTPHDDNRMFFLLFGPYFALSNATIPTPGKYHFLPLPSAPTPTLSQEKSNSSTLKGNFMIPGYD
jgi:hypothetical protein